jgi:hypothetical protein
VEEGGGAGGTRARARGRGAWWGGGRLRQGIMHAGGPI